MSQRLAPLAILLLLAALIAWLALAGESYWLKLVTRIMIIAIAAMALDLVMGLGGLVSLGHAAFLGLGAYTVAILAEHGVTQAYIQWPAALMVTTLAAVLIGALSLRTRGVGFIMITLAFAQMLYFGAHSLSLYGGDDGLPLAERSDLAGLLRLSHRPSMALLAFGLLAVTLYALLRLKDSRFGRVLRAAALNERRVRALGFDPTRFRLVAFALSGGITGLAGVLLVNLDEFVSPATMSWHRSAELLAMVLLGGLGRLYGAILGAAAFIFLESWLSGLTQHWQVILGPVLILVALAGRGGLSGLLVARR